MLIKYFFKPSRYTIIILLLALLCTNNLFAQKRVHKHETKQEGKREITGIASWYSNRFNTRKTANGEIFSQKKMTCASNRFKMGSWLRVTNIKKNISIVVRVNDRMGAHSKRVIDLTRTAAVQLELIKQGLARVKIENLGKEKPVDVE